MFRQAAIFVLAAALPAMADPSFDCSAATLAAERTVCADPRLARKDSELAALYKARRSAASGAEDARLLSDQRGWLIRRDRCGADRVCLYALYDRRIAELSEPRPGRPLPPGTGTLTLVDPNAHAVLTAPASGRSVRPDGTIEMPQPDGSVEFYNPATGTRGTRHADGSETQYAPFQVEPDLPPPLPADYTAWKTSVTASLDGLVGTLLSPEDAQILASHAPPNFYDALAYRLRALDFIAAAGP